MGVGAFAEPLTVVSLLVGSTWINRHRGWMSRTGISNDTGDLSRVSSESDLSTDSLLASPAHASQAANEEDGSSDRSSDARSSSPSLLVCQESRWRSRELRLAGFTTTVRSPNTAVFRGRALSKLLQRLPSLVECWYWALIYWTYQLGRAFTAVTLQQGTVHTARKHALQVIRVEERLRIFWELGMQGFFLRYPTLMIWIYRLYSFIHIPGTILFLIWLYYYTIKRNRLDEPRANKDGGEPDGSPAGPALYEARRGTMAVCNLLAFIVFTL